LKKQIDELVQDSEKNLKETRLRLARSEATRALNLISEQIPGFSFQVQQRQRTLASQKVSILSREQIYLDLNCEQTPDPAICKRAIDVLKKSRMLLGEDNVLK